MHFAVIRLPSWALLQGFLGDLLNSCLYPRTLLGFLVRVFLVICPILAYLLFWGPYCSSCSGAENVRELLDPRYDPKGRCAQIGFLYGYHRDPLRDL